PTLHVRRAVGSAQTREDRRGEGFRRAGAGAMRLTDFQKRCVEAIQHGPNGQASITELAYRLKTSRLAVYSAMQSLQNQNIAGSFRSRSDQWGVIVYFIRRDARNALGENSPTATSAAAS